MVGTRRTVTLKGKSLNLLGTEIKVRQKAPNFKLLAIDSSEVELSQSKGRATRQEVMKRLDLSELDLKEQLIPLMHSELLKERSEGGEMYLIPIN